MSCGQLKQCALTPEWDGRAAVAFAYPAMQTIKVVKESKAVKEDDETAVREHCYETKQWVMYWLLFSALYALECIFSVVGVYEYLPLWNEVTPLKAADC